MFRTTLPLSLWAVAGVAAAQTVHTVPADFTESLQVRASPSISDVDRTWEWVGTQENDALQTIVSSRIDGSFVDAEVRRSFLEFTLPDIQGTATLVLERYYSVGTSDPDRRILVSAYVPDADLSTEDFDRAVQDLGLLATDPSVGTVTFDLTALLQGYPDSRLGIRLSVLDETPGGDLFAGAAFKDAYLGAQPYIEFDDGAAVVQRSADLAESLQQRYSGQVSYEPGVLDVQWVGTQQNDALQTIVSWRGANVELRRNFLEFTLPDVEGSATLVLEKYYDSHSPDPSRQIAVAAYFPDDDLTISDWDRHVTVLGTLATDPSLDQETLVFDLAPLLESHAGARLGIRLSVLDEGPPTTASRLFAGAAFRDAYLGAQPYIQVVENQTGKVVVCHATGNSGLSMTLAVDFDAVADHLGHGDTVEPCP
jgi:hypothetical protein